MKPKQSKKEKKTKATPEYRDASNFNMMGNYKLKK